MAEFASEITLTAKNGVWRLPTKAVDSKGDKRHVCTEEVAISGMLFQCKIWVEMIDLDPRLLCDIQTCAVVIPAEGVLVTASYPQLLVSGCCETDWGAHLPAKKPHALGIWLRGVSS